MAQIAPSLYSSFYSAVPTLTPTVGRTFIELHPVSNNVVNKTVNINLVIEQTLSLSLIEK